MALPSTDEVTDLLSEFSEARVFPGAAFAYGSAFGRKSGAVNTLSYMSESPAVTTETKYDLASLTKVLATTLSTMRLEREGKLSLDAPVRSFFPTFISERVKVEHLLRHTSGLPPYLHDLVNQISAREEVLPAILAQALTSEAGMTVSYSCLGFVLMRHILEQVARKPFEQIVEESLPVGARGLLSFNPPEEERPTIAPTGYIHPWHAKFNPKIVPPGFLQGFVHDPIAFAQGGVSGNAGLFGCVDALEEVAHSILRGDLGPPEQWAKWTTPVLPYPHRGLGFDVRDPEGGTVGLGASARTFGHLGFTGTSLWIDPERGEFAVLLTNQAHPREDLAKIRAARIAFHRLVWPD